jgi:hypothetical protein
VRRTFFTSRLTVISAALLFPLVACAQIQLGGLDRTSAASKQHVELLTDSLQLIANKPQDIELRFRVEPGFHINSHKPKDELLIPTELKLDPGSLHIADEQYPVGAHFHLAIGSGEDLDVYQGEFRVMLRVEAPKGTSTLHGSLRYQACDTASCYPAKLLPLQIAVTAR